MSHPRIRARENSDNQVRPITYTWAGDGHATIRSAGDRISFSKFNYIVDVVGTAKTQRVKPVTHYTSRYVGRPMQPFSADHGLSVIFTDGLLPWSFDQGDIFGSEHFAVPHSVRVQAAGRAFTFFSERFPSKISGAEFFQGLLELQALLPKVLGTVQRTIASAFLTKKFGWDNLISDLRQFVSLVDSIRERMEFLKRTYGKPTKLHYHEPNVHIVAPWTSTDTVVRGFALRFTQESYRADFYASATLVQRMSHIDDFIGWLRAIVISLGLNNLIASGWKTTRLSFVVDWFFNVSEHLARLSAVQPADPWDVFNISSTVVWTSRIHVDQVNEDLIDAPSQVTPLGYFDVKQYERLVGLPVDLSVFTPSTCTPDQLVLMLAMAASKS